MRFSIKRITSISIICVLVCMFFYNCNGSTNTNNNQNQNAYNGMYIGLLGKDSVFINAKSLDDNTFINPIISLNNNLIYDSKENESIFLLDNKNVRIIPIHANVGYIMLTTKDSPFIDKWFVILVNNKKVIKMAYVIKEFFNDIDNDGYYEIGGRELTDAVCLDCDSVLYQPFMMYKLDNHFEFDSILSRKMTKKTYGVYLGNHYVDTVLLEQSFTDWNNIKIGSRLE
ncbi:MAG: hypothetical protein EOL95_08245 [Bacteroidia bacterium]|nr:hypothetical protein [Bacteroidia bacterium]